MLDFVFNKYTYLSGKEKMHEKMHYFSIPKRDCILKKGRSQEWETWEYVWRISKDYLIVLASSGIMAEKSLLILCFIFKLYLRKNCFFGKSIYSCELT